MRDLEGAARVVVVVVSAASPAGVHAQECPADALTFSAAITAAEASFEDMDLSAFQGAVDLARGQLTCLSEPLDPALAARFHRVVGLSLFVTRDRDRAGRAFAAARALDPGYSFPEKLLPPGHPARVLYEEGGRQGETLRVALPGSGSLRFDGRETLDRPLDWPTILQRLDDAGGVAQTLYLWPGDTPAWLQPAPIVTFSEPPQRTRTQLRQASAIGLVSSALVCGMASGLLYQTARHEAEEYWDPSTPVGQLDELRADVNTHQGLALGLGLLGVGTGVSAALVFRWD